MSAKRYSVTIKNIYVSIHDSVPFASNYHFHSLRKRFDCSVDDLLRYRLDHIDHSLRVLVVRLTLNSQFLSLLAEGTSHVVKNILDGIQIWRPWRNVECRSANLKNSVFSSSRSLNRITILQNEFSCRMQHEQHDHTDQH